MVHRKSREMSQAGKWCEALPARPEHTPTIRAHSLSAVDRMPTRDVVRRVSGRQRMLDRARAYLSSIGRCPALPGPLAGRYVQRPVSCGRHCPGRCAFRSNPECLLPRCAVTPAGHRDGRLYSMVATLPDDAYHRRLRTSPACRYNRTPGYRRRRWGSQ